MTDTSYCSKCEEAKPVSDFYLEKKKDGTRQPRTWCKLCWNAYQREYTKTHKFRRRTAAKEYYRRLRIDVIEGYGSRCACCGDTTWEFLTLDHVNGGGNKHRKAGGSYAPYFDAIQRNFPPDYRLLCYNCNCSRAFRGYCPHETDKREAYLESDDHFVKLPITP
jgi:hypothetical protein